MRPREIHIEGFKAFPTATRLPCHPLSLVFGPNSSGKTAALQAVLVLAYSVQRGVFPELLPVTSPWFDFGSFANLRNRSTTSDAIRLGVRFDSASDDHEILYDFIENQDGTTAEVRSAGRSKGIRYSRDGHSLWLAMDYEEDDGGHERSLWRASLDDDDATGLGAWLDNTWHEAVAALTVALTDAGYEDQSLHFAIWQLDDGFRAKVGMFSGTQSAKAWAPLPQVVATSDAAVVVIEGAEGILRQVIDFHVVFVSWLHGVCYLGPTLDRAERLARAPIDRKRNVGHRGQHLAAWLSEQGPETLDEVNAVLKAVGCPVDVQVKSQTIGTVKAGYLELEVVNRDRPDEVQNLDDVGFGVSQLIPLVCELVRLSFEGGTLVVEQPELHLHPAWQTALVREILALVRQQATVAHTEPTTEKRRARVTQPFSVIAETHSEHMVLVLREERLQEWLRHKQSPDCDDERQGDTPLDDYARVTVVEAVGGSPALRNLNWDKNTADPLWPAGFFAERQELETTAIDLEDEIAIAMERQS